MEAYETTVQLDEPQLTLPEAFRNKKVRVVVEEVEPVPTGAEEPPRKRFDFVPMGIDVKKYPFDRGLIYDENGRI